MSTEDSLGRTLLLVGAAIVLIMVLLPALLMIVAMPMLGGPHMGTWNGTTGMGWSWLLSWVLFLGIILGVGYLIARALRSAAPAQTDPALEELRHAYARGDISSEEYDERRERLERDDRHQ